MINQLKFLFLFSILLCDLPACSPPGEPDGSKKYTIYQGEHYCTPHPGESFNGSTLKAQIKFGENCAYNLNNNNQGDLNKVFGFSDNFSLIHRHSARFASRWIVERGVMEIWAYWYRSGEVGYEKIGETTLGRWDTYEVSGSGSTYYFNFNGNAITTARSAPLQGIKVKSWPYFGGDEVAPHDMDIYIIEL
jgi:hypothetical protein